MIREIYSAKYHNFFSQIVILTRHTLVNYAAKLLHVIQNVKIQTSHEIQILLQLLCFSCFKMLNHLYLLVLPKFLFILNCKRSNIFPRNSMISNFSSSYLILIMQHRAGIFNTSEQVSPPGLHLVKQWPLHSPKDFPQRC